MNHVEPVPWTLFFDGSSCKQGGGIGIVIILPRGGNFEFAFPIELAVTNNQAEYEAVLKGIQLLHEVKAEAIQIFGDSQLIINQLIGMYECKEDTLWRYYAECQRLLREFPHVSFQHILRAQNQEANRLAQSASGYRVIQEILSNEASNNDWRIEIVPTLEIRHRKLLEI